MAYSLRLPEALDAAARARAERIGISLNALVCVALDAYLRGPVVAVPGGAEDGAEWERAGGEVVGESPTSAGPAQPEAYRIPKHNPLGFTRKERREFERRERLEQHRKKRP